MQPEEKQQRLAIAPDDNLRSTQYMSDVQPPLPKKPAVKALLYSELNTSVRPLDRLRRPAPASDDLDDFNDLVQDLRFPFNEPSVEAVQPSAEQLITIDAAAQQLLNSQSVTEELPTISSMPVEPSRRIELTPAPPITRSRASYSLRQPLGKHWRQVNRAAVLGIIILLAATVGTSYYVANHTANSANKAQSTAQWQHEQTQWQCALKQYQIQQQAAANHSNLKEISCPN